MDERIQFEDTRLKLNIGTCVTKQTMELTHIAHAGDKAQNTKNDRKYQTLELFPSWICDHDDQYQMTDAPIIGDYSKVETTNIGSKFAPTQFFEFLPLKN